MRCPSCLHPMELEYDRDGWACSLCDRFVSGWMVVRWRGSWLGRLRLWILR